MCVCRWVETFSRTFLRREELEKKRRGRPKSFVLKYIAVVEHDTSISLRTYTSNYSFQFITNYYLHFPEQFLPHIFHVSRSKFWNLLSVASRTRWNTTVCFVIYGWKTCVPSPPKQCCLFFVAVWFPVGPTELVAFYQIPDLRLHIAEQSRMSACTLVTWVAVPVWIVLTKHQQVTRFWINFVLLTII